MAEQGFLLLLVLVLVLLLLRTVDGELQHQQA